MTEAAPGTVSVVFAVPVVGVAVLLSGPSSTVAVPAAAVTGVTIVPHFFWLGFAFGDPVLSAVLRGMTCTRTKRAANME